METRAITTSAAPEAVPNGVPMCDQKDCIEAATHGYVWAWGEKGQCCSKHLFVLNQTAENLQRTIMFSPFNGDSAPVLERPERVALMSARLAAEAELEDAKRHGGDLYRQNIDLTTQVRALTVRQRASSDAAKAAQAELKRVSEVLLKRDAEHGELYDEVRRLRVLVGVAEDGSAEVTVVEGKGPLGKGTTTKPK